MLKLYWEQIQQTLFQDPQHAWILLSLLYLLSTLFVQSLLTGPVKKSAKRIGSKNLKSLHAKYLFRSLLGWLFYLVSWGFFVLFWYSYFFKIFDLQTDALFFLAGSILLFLFSVIFHLVAYATSCLDQIKQLEDQQLTP